MQDVPRLIVAGVASGVGKTTLATGLGAALRRRGARVQPFKAGPDYIDPGYLAAAAGRACRNLDNWILPDAALLELFGRATRGADVALVEGMMGLFDGRDDGEEGSTARLAKLLDAPVLLVVDVATTSRSAAAVALGCKLLDPNVRVIGVVLNRVGGETHYRWAAKPIESLAGLPVFGYLPERPELTIPERHLGLVPAAETAPNTEFFARLAEQVERTVDVSAVLNQARRAGALPDPGRQLFPDTPVLRAARLGVARDAAFGFYYEDSLDLLSAWGAEIVPFSPLADDHLPAVDGLYFGGGFPEVFAEPLSANRTLSEAIRRAVAAGLPLYAECGGLMYLSEGIVGFDGRRFPMIGLIPAWSTMGERLTIGYRTVLARQDGPILHRGETLRGHEFHRSRLETALAPEFAAYSFEEAPSRLEGWARDSVFASYVHLHLGARPGLAQRFVSRLARG
ncbi:MAG TPA: cobyrinate a,c-diamide synthase [Chloroflexota bacterium]|nr:cobyrinate a,c-diamide synthase [Chloroflexota bacterium]